MILLKEMMRFALVGGIGFIADAGILYLLKAGVLGIYWGRVISFISAVFITWLLNRCFTFRRRASGVSLWREFTRYFVSMLGGGSVNYAVYAGLVSRVDIIADQPVWGVAAGSLAGMLVNFASAKYLIFRHSSTQRQKMQKTDLQKTL